MQDGYDLHRDVAETKSLPPDLETHISQGQVALDELSRILEKMGLRTQVFYQELEEVVYLEIHGNNLGLVIGKHGQTLDALEFILNAIHRKKNPDSKQLILDAQGYREKKRSMLRKIVYAARDTVLSTDSEVALDPMSPSDRKAIHLICKDISGVTSESRGEGMNRRVIIKVDDSRGEDISGLTIN